MRIFKVGTEMLSFKVQVLKITY